MVWLLAKLLDRVLDSKILVSGSPNRVNRVITPSLLHLKASQLWRLPGVKWGILSELLRDVLRTTVVHNGMHTNVSISYIYI